VGILFTWPAKVFGKRMKFTSGMVLRESQRETEILVSAITPEVWEKLQQPMEQCLQLGFHLPRYFHSVTRLGETQTYYIAMLHTSGRFTIRLYCTIAVNPTLRIVNRSFALLSQLKDKTFLVTVDTKPRFISMPEVKVHRVFGGKVQALFHLHGRKVAELEVTNPPQLVATHERLDQDWDRYEKMRNDFGFKRGIYVMMRPDELRPEMNAQK
jgi:hypothetical protein